MKKAIKHHTGEEAAPQIIDKTGISGYGVYWFLEEHLHKVRGNAIFFDEDTLAPLAGQMGITVKQMTAVIKLALKLKLFYLVDEVKISTERLRKEVSPELSKIRKEASLRGVQKRLENLAVKYGKQPTPEATEVKAMVPPKPKPVIEPVEAPELPLQPEAPKEVPVEPFNKEWQFTILFNQMKKKVKPTSRGNNVLSPGDKRNFKTLIDNKYTKEDFEIVIEAVLASDYVNEHGLDNPEHVLKLANFQRYLSKATSDKKQVKNFVTNR